LKNYIENTLKFILFLALGCFVLWLALKDQDLEMLGNRIKGANFYWAGLSMLIGFSAHVLRAFRWNMLIEPLGYKAHIKNTTISVFIGYLANFAIPRLGEVTRCAVLSKNETIPFNKLVGSVFVERVIDLITLLLVIVFTLLIQFDLLKDFFMKFFNEKVEGKLNSVYFLLIVAAISFVLIVIILYTLREKLMEHHLAIKIKTFIIGLLEGMKSIRSLKNIPLFLLYTFLIWILYWGMTYVCFFSIAGTSHLSVAAGFAVFVAGALGMTAPVQGGIGTFHALTMQLLLLYGVSETDGLAYAFVTHGAQSVMVVIVGFVSILLIPIFQNKKIKNDTTGTN